MCKTFGTRPFFFPEPGLSPANFMQNPRKSGWSERTKGEMSCKNDEKITDRSQAVTKAGPSGWRPGAGGKSPLFYHTPVACQGEEGRLPWGIPRLGAGRPDAPAGPWPAAPPGGCTPCPGGCPRTGRSGRRGPRSGGCSSGNCPPGACRSWRSHCGPGPGSSARWPSSAGPARPGGRGGRGRGSGRRPGGCSPSTGPR